MPSAAGFAVSVAYCVSLTQAKTQAGIAGRKEIFFRVDGLFGPKGERKQGRYECERQPGIHNVPVRFLSGLLLTAAFLPTRAAVNGLSVDALQRQPMPRL